MKEYLADLTQMDHLLVRYFIPFAWKILGAFAVWILGGILVRTIQKLAVAALNRKHVDQTLVTYANSTLAWILKSLLILAILSIFGIETTSFSAILAAAGVAIGVAWSGLLSNFAAGIFLILLRPFKVGDAIQAAGISGTVKEIGLFATTIDNAENLRVFVGNNKLFSDNILNYSMNDYRIALFKVQLAHEVNPDEAIQKITLALEQVDGVRRSPRVTAEIIEFNPLGTLIVFKAATNPQNYTNVVVNGNLAIYETLAQARYPRAENRTLLIQSKT